MMDRREAIQLLAALPAVKEISRVQLAPRDVIVMECDGPIDPETVEQLRAYTQTVWPNHKVVVLGDGLHLRVLREE